MASYVEQIERILTENIIPFWEERVVDNDHGGYRLHFDLEGRWRGPIAKQTVAQARPLWFFSRLSQTKYGTEQHLEIARHGYEFLRDRLWDKEYGGVFWEVDVEGKNVTMPGKHLCAQAFGLYALSAYSEASGDTVASSLAKEQFAIMESRAHDAEYGGYHELFKRDWSGEPDDCRAYLRSRPETKTHNTHLHILEGLTEYHNATKDPLGRERLLELISIQSDKVMRKKLGSAVNVLRRDWTPLKGRDFDKAFYGHDLENIWLLAAASESAGISVEPLLDLFKRIFEYTLKYGFDHKKGGVYDRGRLGRRAHKREKVWWAQAEGMVAALTMYQLTGDESYRNCFAQILGWTTTYQIDWKYGEWYARIGENGKPAGSKGKAEGWKTCYHTGRAMLECLNRLAGSA